MILPEVWKNPGIYVGTNKAELRDNNMMIKVNQIMNAQKYKKKKYNVKGKFNRANKFLKKNTINDASNRIIKRTALCTKYNFDILGICYERW